MPPAWSVLLMVRRLRVVLHCVLTAALLVGGLAAWQMLDALRGKADDLTRHIRVDVWTAQQAQEQTYQFLLTLGEHIAGHDAVTLAEVGRQLRQLKSAADLLQTSNGRESVGALADVDNVSTNFTAAVREVDQLLADQADRPGNLGTFLAIKQILTPHLADLEQLALDLTHVRLELQDQDLANVTRLIGFNRRLLLAVIGVAALFIALLLVEARSAWQAEARARANQERFRDFTDIASDWLWETDSALRLSFVSDRIETVTGMPAYRHLGRPATDLVSGSPASPAAESLDQAIFQRRPFRDLVLDLPDERAEQRFLRISGKPIFDRSGAFLGFRGVGADISMEVRREDRIRFLAEHDQLTGLPNRTFFQDRLRAVLENARQEDRQGALLTLDLDEFKDVNDTFGHDVGDALIVAVAERLRNCLRPTELLARIGGDEFAIIHRTADRLSHDAEALASSLLTAIHQPFQVGGFEFVIGTSIGIARFLTDGDTFEDLMKAADLALYGAKANGRNQAVSYHPRMTKRQQRQRQLETDLRSALAEDLLQLYVQPQIDLVSEHLVGVEALARWHHPQLGPIGPDTFIPIAEETGLILPLGRWVLETACRAAKRWSGVFADGLIAVNVSPAQFTHQDLVREVAEVLEKTGLPAERLELEITEGLLMRDAQLAIRTLDRLNAMGVKLAIDDFGTGYSSLSYLKRFRVHKVKIDRVFVGDLEHDQDDRTIVRAVVMMSQALGLLTIAEGVETVRQKEILMAFGCDQAQGYLYGKPTPVDRFFRKIARAVDGSQVA